MAYYKNLEYDVPEGWDSRLKTAFPTNAEGQLLTNGRHAVKLNQDTYETTSVAAGSMEKMMDALMKLKTVDPDLPVYHVHNHPSAAAISQARGFSTTSKEQAAATMVPSSSLVSLNKDTVYLGNAKAVHRGDQYAWDAFYNVMGGAILHQETGEIRIWEHGAETNRIGTKLAIEGNFYEGIPGVTEDKFIPTNVRWATEEENEEHTIYVKPEEWESRKAEILPLLDMRLMLNPASR